MFLLGGDGAERIGAFPAYADFGDGFGVAPADGANKRFGGVDEVLFPEPVVRRGAGTEGFHRSERKGRRFFGEPFRVQSEVEIFWVGHDKRILENVRGAPKSS